MTGDGAAGRPGAVGIVWLVLVLGFLSIAAPRAGDPGLYYDEAFLGQQAKDFFEPGRGILHPPSTRQIELFGRPFPLRNAIYLGSLKSQLLIPSFAIFGAEVRVLRLTTALTGLLALLLMMLWIDRLLGPTVASLGGLLAVADPNAWFYLLHEWGPFTTLLLCRAAGFYFVTLGWIRRSPGWTALGGLALGLGIFARADFALVVAAAGLALVCVRPGVLGEVSAGRRRVFVALVLSACLGAAPMLLSAEDLLRTLDNPIIGQRGDLAEKLQVVRSLGDGSRFFRLMAVGGRFEGTSAVMAPSTPFAWLAAAAMGVAALGMVRRLAARRPLGATDFLLTSAVLVMVATLALPGAVRAHHLLNAFPLFHFLVGAVGLDVFRQPVLGRAPRIGLRAGLLLALVWLLSSDARVIRDTYQLIERTGGAGRWTNATEDLAATLEADPRRRAISLDWGLHEPLFFLTRRARLLEPIWDFQRARRRGIPWRFAGRPGDLYLVHDRDYDRFGLGPRFLAAARRHAETDAGALEIRSHRDREGRIAFWSVRIDQEHELFYRRGRLRLRLAEPEGEVSPGPSSGRRNEGARDSARARAKTSFP
ncbi:MAG: glycosyltransferase family 39 protein [Myxococcota bacterium]